MKNIAILGCGNMGAALAAGYAAKHHDVHFHLYDPDISKAEQLEKKCRGIVYGSIADLPACDFYLLACKPQSFAELATELKTQLPANAVIISILAGTSSKRIQEALNRQKIVRVMPNTPCLINEGMSAIFPQQLSPEESAWVQNFFAAVGKTLLMKSDVEVDQMTALTGSGPAYVFELARVLTHKMQSFGFSEPASAEAIKQLFKGSALLLANSSDSAEQLREKVTSKKGTTEAALDALAAHHFENIFCEALDAAFKRAQELSQLS